MYEKNDGWVLVESEDELREGLFIKERPCSTCRKTHYAVLKSSLKITPNATLPDRASKRVWTIAPPIECCPSSKIVFGRSIRNRSLYRLADPDVTDVYETSTPRKTLVRQMVESFDGSHQRH